MMINCKYLLYKLIFVFLLVIGHETLSHASTIEVIDPVPFSTPRYVNALDFSYFHDITDNGYNPSTDTLINATLSIHFVDDDPEGEFMCSHAVIMFDFDGTDEEELTVREGDNIMILEDVGEWLFVRTATGTEGYVPSTYVEQNGSWMPETEGFRLSFDGISQNLGSLIVTTGTLYNINVPTSYLLDSKLNLNVHSYWALDYIFQDAYLTVNIERAQMIPEPSAILLFICGFLGITRIIRTKNSNSPVGK